MSDFFWRCCIRAMAQPQPKWARRLEESDGPVSMPKFWQAMVLPVLILVVAWLLTR